MFRSKKGEMDWVIKRAGLDSNNLSDAVVKLRGLPFGCSKEEIAQFFTGVAEGLGWLLCPRSFWLIVAKDPSRCILARSEQFERKHSGFILVCETERDEINWSKYNVLYTCITKFERGNLRKNSLKCPGQCIWGTLVLNINLWYVLLK